MPFLKSKSTTSANEKIDLIENDSEIIVLIFSGGIMRRALIESISGEVKEGDFTY